MAATQFKVSEAAALLGIDPGDIVKTLVPA